jgi:hypothetical protein
MTIRFLQTVQSENPSFPFMAGQVIDVPVPSPYLLSLLDGVRAEAVKSDGIERAVVDGGETPEPVPVKRRRKRVRQS